MIIGLFAQVQRESKSPKFVLEVVEPPLPAFGNGAVLRYDFVGRVKEVGNNVSRYGKGDIIAGMIWEGGVKGHGAYAD